MLILCLTVVARALPEIGTTEMVFEYTFYDDTVVNASITATQGELWIAAEWSDDGVDTTSLDLFWFNSSSWSRKLLKWRELDTNIGSGTPHLMYPSITTWPGATYVYTTGKQNQTPSGTEPHLISLRQDRDNLAAAASETDIGTGISSDVRHGRPHLTSDFNINDAMLLCWTRSDETESPPDDDLKRKGKSDAQAWTATSTDTLAADTNDEDDHCQQGVDSEGTIWTSYHSDTNGDDRIYINHADYDVGTDTWTDYGSDLPAWGAAGWTDADFPSSSVGGEIFGDDVRVMAAQRVPSASDEVAWWRCEGATVDCNTAAEWSGDEFNPSSTSNTMSQPMVVVDSIYGHAFMLFEMSAGNIGIAKWCAGDTDWSEVGVVDVDTDHNNPIDHVWGQYPGSPLSVLAIDYYEYELHAVFLARPDGHPEGENDLMHWSVDIEDQDLCPP